MLFLTGGSVGSGGDREQQKTKTKTEEREKQSSWSGEEKNDGEEGREKNRANSPLARSPPQGNKGKLCRCWEVIFTLPLENETIIELCCLDPSKQKADPTKITFDELGMKIACMTEEDQKVLAEKLESYALDDKVPKLAEAFMKQQDAEGARIDQDVW